MVQKRCNKRVLSQMPGLFNEWCVPAVLGWEAEFLNYLVISTPGVERRNGTYLYEVAQRYSALWLPEWKLKMWFFADSSSHSKTCLFFLTDHKKAIKLETQKGKIGSESRLENDTQQNTQILLFFL